MKKMATLLLLSTLVECALAAGPGGSDHGPPVLVPTDVVGGRVDVSQQEEVVSAAMPEVTVTKFPGKCDAGSLLLETTPSTILKRQGGECVMEQGCLIISPRHGHAIVRTPGADISIPHNCVALIDCCDQWSRVINLSGPRPIIVRVLKTDDVQPSSRAKDSIALDAALGYVDNLKTPLEKGTERLDDKFVSREVKELGKIKKFQLLTLDPMKVLQRHPLLNQLKSEWMPVLKRVERTSALVGERQSVLAAPN